MNTASVVLFVHVIGAIGYCIGIGIWLVVLVGLRRAQRVEQVRALLHLTDLSGPAAGISALLLLATGLYMALMGWSLQTGWILVALISLILMVPLSAVLIAPRRSVLDRLAREAPDSPLPEALTQPTRDPILATVLQTVAALLVGFIFLMTTKPDLIGSIIVMLAALILGMGSGALVARTTRIRQRAMVSTTNHTSKPVGQ